MRLLRMYPARCRKGIEILRNEIGVDEDVAWKMMLMTATLMDLRPEDDAVVDIILADCGIGDGVSA